MEKSLIKVGEYFNDLLESNDIYVRFNDNSFEYFSHYNKYVDFNSGLTWHIMMLTVITFSRFKYINTIFDYNMETKILTITRYTYDKLRDIFYDNNWLFIKLLSNFIFDKIYFKSFITNFIKKKYNFDVKVIELTSIPKII